MQPTDKQFNPDHLDEWMSAHIDGMLDAASAAQLDAYLAEHPDAQAEFDALRSVVDALSALPPAEAPADLLDTVMAQVTAANVETTEANDEDLLTRPAYSMMPWIRRAAGIAAVLLIVRVGYHEWGQQQEPRSINEATSTEAAVHASTERLDNIAEPTLSEAADLSDAPVATAKPDVTATPARASVRRQTEVATRFRSTREENAPVSKTASKARATVDREAEIISESISEFGNGTSGAVAPSGKINTKEPGARHDAPAADITTLHEDLDDAFLDTGRKIIAPEMVAEDKRRHQDELKAGVARDVAPSAPGAGLETRKGRNALSAEIGKNDQQRDDSPAPADINGGGFKAKNESFKQARRTRAVPKPALTPAPSAPTPTAEQEVDALGFDESSTVALTVPAEPPTQVDAAKNSASLLGGLRTPIEGDSDSLTKRPLQNAVDNNATYAQGGDKDDVAMLRRISKDAGATPVRLRGSIADVDAVIADFQTQRQRLADKQNASASSGVADEYAAAVESPTADAEDQPLTHAMLRVVHLDAARYNAFIEALSAVGTLIEKPEPPQQKEGWFLTKPKRITVYLLIEPPR